MLGLGEQLEPQQPQPLVHVATPPARSKSWAGGEIPPSSFVAKTQLSQANVVAPFQSRSQTAVVPPSCGA